MLAVGRVPTPSLSQASRPTRRDGFWDAERSPRVFLNVLCFQVENNFADVTFGLKKERIPNKAQDDLRKGGIFQGK